MAMSMKIKTHGSGDPGLHADAFTFIRDALVIEWQTSKLDAQGLFLPIVDLC